MMHVKRFELNKEVWRLRIEGRDVRVDEWVDDWAVFAEGVIRDGEIADLRVIDVCDMATARAIPDGMLDAANAAMRLIASRYAKGGEDDVSRMTRARKRVVGGWFQQAAAKLGMAVEDYTARRCAGLRWCGKGRHWSARPMSASGICSDCHGVVRGAAQVAGSESEAA